MSVMQSVNAKVPTPSAPALTTPLVLLLAAGAGLGAASLYYSQPMLGVLVADLGTTGRAKLRCRCLQC